MTGIYILKNAFLRACLKGLARNSLNSLLEWTNILNLECGQKLHSHFMTNTISYSKITLRVRIVIPCMLVLPFLPYLWRVLRSLVKLLLLRITILLTFEISLLVPYYVKF
jgi:hypothetical protein